MWSRRCNKSGAWIAAGLVAAVGSATYAASDAPPAIAPPAASAPAAAPVCPTPSARAVADFAHAIELAKAGKDDEAELAFQQVASAYPAYPGALVNLGLLYRKHGDLTKADESLRAAVQRNAGDAEAWSELGVTLRQEGKFHDAADAYNQAISADPNFAPAYRNLAIVLDLYLGDPAAALTAMQRYQELAADDKAATGWIADLKQRAGKNAAAPAAAAPPATNKAGE